MELLLHVSTCCVLVDTETHGSSASHGYNDVSSGATGGGESMVALAGLGTASEFDRRKKKK